MRPDLAWQPSLFDATPPAGDPSYAGLERIELDEHSWVDYCPGWLDGSDAIFAELSASAPWEQRISTVYDRTAPEPRLTAGWDVDVAGNTPPVLVELAATLSRRYAVTFDRVWVNLYRDGNDSVAWHRDRNHKVMTRPLVATVSLGARRQFQLRRRGTTRIAHAFRPGEGDLVVMGGACQIDWEHAVPKTRRPVGPRMSVTIRHSRPAPGEHVLAAARGTQPGQAW
jgi:alkylated DNA repair dioxygenase AlkB